MSKMTREEEIKQLILNSNEPFIIKNVLNWEMLNWSLEDWSDILKSEQLTFRCGQNAFTNKPQWERKTPTEKADFHTFLTQSSQDKWMYFDYKYLKDNLKIDKIQKDISWSQFGFPNLNAEQSTIWIGTKGAHTPCHIDTYGCNLVAQIYGKKQWLIFPPSEDLKPTRVPYEESSIYSSLNFFSPSVEEFETVKNGRIVLLNPGDVLFLPHKWWHYVENLDLAISVNVWLPDKNDDEERLKESLVQLIICQIAKDLGTEDRNIVLNPNSEEICQNNFKDNINLVEMCKNICKNKQNLTNLNFSFTENLGAKSDFAEIIPKLSENELGNFLKSQNDRFKKTNFNDENFDNNEIITIINALTDPQIITLMKNKLLK